MSNHKNIAQELHEIAPLLNQISKTPVQEVPADYFKQFKVQVSTDRAVVKKITPRKWMGYAAAAVVVGIMAFSGLLQKEKKSTNFDYERYANIDVAEEINNLSDEALQEYFSNEISISGASNIVLEEE